VKKIIIEQKEETESNYQILSSYLEKESDLELVNEGSIIIQILGEPLPIITIPRKVENEEPERKNTEKLQIQPVVLPSSAERKITESKRIEPYVLPSSIKGPSYHKKIQCNVCSRKISQSEYNAHLQSSAHKNNERVNYCQICNKFFNADGYSGHLQGKNHLQKLSEIKPLAPPNTNPK